MYKEPTTREAIAANKAFEAGYVNAPVVGIPITLPDDLDTTEVTDPYNVTFHGHKLDPYQIGVLFGITHPALFQILKKVLRSGRKHKDISQDVAEIISSAVRWQEMQEEEEKA